MPITFHCACGKKLQVKDEYAGRRVKCPSCDAVSTVAASIPAFEVVEDTSAPLAPAPSKQSTPGVESAIADTASRRAKTKRMASDDDEEHEVVADARPKRNSRDEERPRRRRREEDEDEGSNPPWKKKARKEKPIRQPSVVNAGVAGGLLVMLGAVVWFVLGLVLIDTIFFYPPILFVLGLVATVKGLTGGKEE